MFIDQIVFNVLFKTDLLVYFWLLFEENSRKKVEKRIYTLTVSTIKPILTNFYIFTATDVAVKLENHLKKYLIGVKGKQIHKS